MSNLRPRLSVVIPAYNASVTIESCVQSVLANRYPNLELIVVDDGSTDDTLERLKRFSDSVTLLKQTTQLGPGAARNFGIRAAQGEFIFLLDADCFCSDDWLEEGLKAFQRSGEGPVVGVVGAVFYTSQTDSIREKIPINPFYNLGNLSPINRSGSDYAAANIAYSAKVLKLLGGFDVIRFKNGREDTDLGFRARKHGRMEISLEMKVMHFRTKWSFASLFQNSARYESDVLFLQSHKYFFFRWGRVLHPKMLLLTIFPFMMPFVFKRWLRSTRDWAFLPVLWIYFINARFHILRAAIREKCFVI